MYTNTHMYEHERAHMRDYWYTYTHVYTCVRMRVYLLFLCKRVFDCSCVCVRVCVKERDKARERKTCTHARTHTHSKISDRTTCIWRRRESNSSSFDILSVFILTIANSFFANTPWHSRWARLSSTIPLLTSANSCQISIMAHVSTSRVTRINESHHTYQWDMSHISRSHVTHMNRLRHTHE